MLKIAHEMLAERNWLAMHYASSAVIALADGDARRCAAYMVDLHALPESRIKASTIALMRPMLDRLLAEGACVTHAELGKLEEELHAIVVQLPPGATAARLYGQDGHFKGDLRVVHPVAAVTQTSWLVRFFVWPWRAAA
jgi:hypothetical protein